MHITEITRRNIFDVIIAEDIAWSGRLPEPDFLLRLYDLREMPSYDARYTNAYDDIVKHRIHNYDWEDDWVFYDDRFDLLRCEDKAFLQFLIEVIHPVVRSNQEQVQFLVSVFNEHLQNDGYQLIESSQLSGQPVFVAQTIQNPQKSNPMGLEKDISKIFDALGRVLQEEGRNDLAKLINHSNVYCVNTDYDNWDGGTYSHSFEVKVPVDLYSSLGNKLEQTEEELQQRVGKLTRAYPNEHVHSIYISPSVEPLRSSLGSKLSSSKSPAFWDEEYLRVFISHLSHDKTRIAALAKHLANFGISGFVAHEDIEPTKEWEDEIRIALGTCDALICLLTENFNESKWTDQEIGIAIGREIPVIPLRAGLDPYGFIARYQALPAKGKLPEDVAKELVLILAKHNSTREKMAFALVKCFENSMSYKTAKQRVHSLNLIDYWDDEIIERVRSAVKENEQIASAFGVPDAVNALIKHVTS